MFRAHMIIAAVAALIVAPQANAALVAQYNFTGGTIADESGSGNDLTASGSPTYVTGDTVRSNFMRFDAGDSLVDASPSVTPGGTWTVTAWVRSDAPNQSQFSSVFSNGIGAPGHFQLDTSGAGDYRVRSSADVNYTIGDISSYWTHVAVSYDGSDTRFYYNGSLVSTAAGVNVGSNFNAYRIALNRGGNLNFVGDIDDFQVHSGALGVDEITALSREGSRRSLNINFFDTDTAGQRVDVGEVAGVVPVDGAYWNNLDANAMITGGSNANFALTDSLGSTVTLTSNLGSGFVGQSGTTQTDPNGDLMNAYISWDEVDGTSPEDTGGLTISGLGAEYTDRGYDVYIYFDTDQNNRVHTITVNGMDAVGLDGSTYSGTFVEATGAGVDSNVAIFRGLTASTLEIFMASNSGRAAINGIQIVAVPAPAALPAGLAMLALAGARRHRRSRIAHDRC